MPESLGTAELSRSIFNPYPGLRAFEPEESYLYFGRERQTDELLSRLRGTHFLSVVGTSGSGKSSLVRAGLVPALHSGFMTQAGSSWRVAITRPGGDPIGNLAGALASPEVLGEDGATDDTERSIIETTLRGSSLGLAECVEVASIPEHDNVLVVIDQFEELFRFKQGARSSTVRDEAVAFVKLLLAESRRLYVVITMRSDFIGDCMEFPKLPEAINEGQYLVPRMTRDELRLAITGPAGVRRAKISPRLVARLLNDVGDNPDQLPVLQHALMRMWTLWEGSASGEAMDLAHYQEIGTMKEALSRHAEKTFSGLENDRQREIAERMFKTLTETERGGRGVRRPARLGEVCEVAGASPAEVVKVIDRFRLEGRSFLMPPISAKLTPDTIIDLSHESLMRNWERLVAWATEEAAAAEMYRRLSRAARHHQTGETGLWRSPELDLGLRWRDETRPTAAWAGRYDLDFERSIAFLDASVHDRDQRLAGLERARRRKLRGGIAFTALVVLLLAGFLWYVDKERHRQWALSVSLAGEDPLLRAQVLSELPERLEDRIARQFGRSTGEVGGLEFEALRRAAYDPIPRAVFRVPGAGDVRPSLNRVAVSPDGRWIVIGAADGSAWIWPSDGSGDPLALTAEDIGKAHGNVVTSASFSPRGDRILTSSADGTVRVWNLEGEMIADLVWHRGEVHSASFSPDGDHIVTASKDKTAQIWSSDGDGIPVVLRHDDDVTSASFDALGQRVITSSASDPDLPRIWDLEGQELQQIDAYDEPNQGAWFSPDGGLVLVATKSGAIPVYDEDGEWLRTFIEHSKSVKGVSFSPDGEKVLSFSEDAQIWNLDDAEPHAALKHGTKVTSAAFAPGGERVVTASSDGTARIWSVDGEELWSLRGHFGRVNAAVFSKTGSLVVTAAEDGTARVWPAVAGEPRLLGRHEARVTSLAFEVTGVGERVRAVSIARDGTAWVWSFGGEDAGGGDVAELVSPGAMATAAAFSPTGDEIATANADGAVRTWRRDGADDWSVTGVLEGHQDKVASIAYNPTGTVGIVTGSHDRTARIWQRDDTGDWSDQILQGPSLEPGTSHGKRVMSADFSPEGNRILTSSWDQTVRIWSRDGEGQWTSETELKGGHQNELKGASFSPAGDKIVVFSTDAVSIWSSDRKGKWRFTRGLEGHHGNIYSASFSPGGEVATASEDGTVRVWSATSGATIYVLGAEEPIRSARFHPGGSHILVGLGDGSVQLWRVTQAPLRQFLKNASSACLTVEQRCLYLNERERTARSRFIECEQAKGRTPPFELPSCS